MAENTVHVVVSGAGPNGLMVAGELALAGVRPVVLERLPEPSPEPKANGLVGQIVRQLDMRGLYQELTGATGAPVPIPGWLFSGMRVSFADVADNPMHILPIQQPRLVRLLDKHMRRFGVHVRWDHEVLGVARDHDGVTVTVTGPDGPYDLRTRYLVAADGGHSLIRKSLGIGFPGSTAPIVARLAHVHIPDEMRTGDGGIDIPGVGRLPFGHNRLDGGGFVYFEFEHGRPLVGTIEFGGDPATCDGEMTLHELRASARRVLGVDLPLEEPQGPGPHALRRIDGQHTRVAERYRDGNVFLLGDAAHVHSAMGGPGLNLGLADALNLGWKLAAQLNGWAPADLLDSYFSERYPVAERVAMHSMAQTALMAPGPEVAALRTLFGELLARPDAASHLAHLLAGSDVRYDVGNSHPLAGRLVPDLILSDGQRVAELLHRARPVLLDPSGGALAAAAHDWVTRVDIVEATVPDGLAAMLIRPDGYIAWATDDIGDVEGLRGALLRWFGSSATKRDENQVVAQQ
ncbi:MAG: FAD-dependent monooxygenase [Mycolicibacterium sp.]|nr:FAD-dependent monooxygenase [Mycolicibacterium sp.]